MSTGMGASDDRQAHMGGEAKRRKRTRATAYNTPFSITPAGWP